MIIRTTWTLRETAKCLRVDLGSSRVLGVSWGVLGVPLKGTSKIINKDYVPGPLRETAKPNSNKP